MACICRLQTAITSSNLTPLGFTSKNFSLIAFWRREHFRVKSEWKMMIDKMHVEPQFSGVLIFMKKHVSIILVIYIGKAWFWESWHQRVGIALYNSIDYKRMLSWMTLLYEEKLFKQHPATWAINFLTKKYWLLCYNHDRKRKEKKNNW